MTVCEPIELEEACSVPGLDHSWVVKYPVAARGPGDPRLLRRAPLSLIQNFPGDRQLIKKLL